MEPLRLTVIGTATKDTVTFPNGKITRSFGGILYNIFPLASLAPHDWIISPVCNLGSDVYDRVLSYIEKYKNIDPGGVFRVKQGNNHVHLYYNQNWNKKEILENLVPKIEFSQIRPYLKADFILINFISGFDLDLGTLKKIRKKSSAQIFIDIHSLVLGIDRKGKRFFRVPDLWKEYMKTADIIQMNLKEAQVLSGKSLKSEREMGKFAQVILRLGPEILLVTIGMEGEILYYKKGKKTVSCRTRALKVKHFVDPTGCGDVFSAGFLLAYIKTGDPEISSEYANLLAGMKSGFSGVEGFMTRSWSINL